MLRNAILSVLLGVVVGCGLLTMHEHDDFMDGMSKDETAQTPVIAVLPNDAGILVGFQFTTRNLTEQEDFHMLELVVQKIEDLNNDPEEDFSFDFADKVIIFAYQGIDVDVTVTADYRNEEVELWTGYREKDWYTKQTYSGPPTVILNYLNEGLAGNPKIEEGRASEERPTPPASKVDCS